MERRRILGSEVAEMSFMMRRRMLMMMHKGETDMEYMRLLKTIICDGNNSAWIVNEDESGGSFSCSEIMIFVSKASFGGYTGIGLNGNHWSSNNAIKTWLAANNVGGCFWIECVGGGMCRYLANIGNYFNMSIYSYALAGSDKIREVRFRVATAPAEGETIIIYGR